jgi:Tat protein secretion system quality control protein TatD with DNase activity
MGTRPVKLWLDAYPGTYFGFSSMVKGYGDRQRGGRRVVRGNRLLLESDSPHLPDVAGSINHPAHLFRVAEEVERVRGQSPLDILRAGIANGAGLVPEEVVRFKRGEIKMTERGVSVRW